MVGESRTGLVFDPDRDGEDDADEAFALGTTSASFEVALEDVVGGQYDVLYFPNGVDPLRSGSVATTFAVDFHKQTNRSPEPARDLAELQYLNADTALLAYAIPPPSHPDRSHVRIRCDAAAPCRVYLACDSVDGAHFFGRLPEPVGVHAVCTVTAMQLAETIGATDADFVGGMSCELLGKDISVQVLVRRGGTLVNHTYVAGSVGR